MKTIPISQGRIAMIDDADFEKVSKFQWSLKKSKHDKTEYAHRSIKIDGKWKHVLLHRFIMDAPSGSEVDHRDGNGLNCQKYNMRICTHAENSRNKRISNKHGLKGVAFLSKLPPHRQWKAAIRIESGPKTIGYFPTVIEAAAAYNAMAIKHFGDFAKLNQVDKHR